MLKCLFVLLAITAAAYQRLGDFLVLQVGLKNGFNVWQCLPKRILWNSNEMFPQEQRLLLSLKTEDVGSFLCPFPRKGSPGFSPGGNAIIVQPDECLER